MAETITLNVGGQQFVTLRSTLLRHKSKLGDMIERKPCGPGFACSNDTTFFIDRDAKQFRHILNYLRDGTIPILHQVEDRSELLREAKFYGVKDLVDWCGTESSLETAHLSQHALVLRQYAGKLKAESMRCFRVRVRYFEMVVQCALKLLTKHAQSGQGPWRNIHVRELFAMPELSPYVRDVENKTTACVVMRCLNESLNALGFEVEHSDDGLSVHIDLWSAHEVIHNERFGRGNPPKRPRLEHFESDSEITSTAQQRPTVSAISSLIDTQTIPMNE
eukprot:c17548_g1_i1.p1 GENE.c17548_g1_i1~~c17548_g1_i1.p1  ORF type:complete len:277 (-),score=34.05 c17548_g1_i1:72-902(-)